MKVKIIKCTGDSSWYKDRIGEIFEVIEKESINQLYYVNKEEQFYRFIYFDDAEVLNEANSTDER